jgi:hypothetical protein
MNESVENTDRQEEGVNRKKKRAPTWIAMIRASDEAQRPRKSRTRKGR